MVTQEQATSHPGASERVCSLRRQASRSLVLALLGLALVTILFVVVAIIVFILIVLTIFVSVEFLFAFFIKRAFAGEELLLGDTPAL